jgi:hypothetical protein
LTEKDWRLFASGSPSGLPDVKGIKVCISANHMPTSFFDVTFLYLYSKKSDLSFQKLMSGMDFHFFSKLNPSQPLFAG